MPALRAIGRGGERKRARSEKKETEEGQSGEGKEQRERRRERDRVRKREHAREDGRNWMKGKRMHGRTTNGAGVGRSEIAGHERETHVKSSK